MEINYFAVFICSVLGIVLGYYWYGPLFGKKWTEINNVGHAEHAEHGGHSKVKKNTKFLYFLQFLMTLFQVWVLAYYIAGWQGASGLENSLWIWTAFILPMVAGNVMWNNDSKEISRTKFFIQGGYQLTLFVMYGVILGFWK